ncbi:type VII secretion protein EssA [Metabacillus herbersteinensis]|uniref:Type VII secretion protein EssA n=1 Tax=Metabacillus herbersteinensis TaxID=283816 RepID=A0ABV6GHE5_9BACI
MKSMRFKWIVKGAFYIMLLSFLLASPPAHAKPDLNGLEPYYYEGEKTKRGAEFFREKSKNETPESIPEEQRSLTFKKQSGNELERIQTQLFSNYTRENNTITAKAEKMELFSSTEERATSPVTSQDSASQSSGLLYLFGGLIAVSVLTLFGFIIWQYKRANSLKNS